jgi:hypothetical protein
VDPFSGSSTAVTQIVFWKFESSQPSQTAVSAGDVQAERRDLFPSLRAHPLMARIVPIG